MLHYRRSITFGFTLFLSSIVDIDVFGSLGLWSPDPLSAQRHFSQDTDRQINRTLGCNDLSISRVPRVFHYYFLNCHPSDCQRSSIRPLTPFPVPCLLSICTVTHNCSVSWKKENKIWPWILKPIIAYCPGRFAYARASGTLPRLPPSSADGASTMASCIYSRARSLAGRTCTFGHRFVLRSEEEQVLA